MIVFVLAGLLCFVGLVGLFDVGLVPALAVAGVALAAVLVFGPQVLEALALERAYRDPRRGRPTGPSLADDD